MKGNQEKKRIKGDFKITVNCAHLITLSAYTNGNLGAYLNEGGQ